MPLIVCVRIDRKVDTFRYSRCFLTSWGWRSEDVWVGRVTELQVERATDIDRRALKSGHALRIMEDIGAVVDRPGRELSCGLAHNLHALTAPMTKEQIEVKAENENRG